MGGFAISAAEDLLYIEDVELVRQTCDFASVVFDDQAVADYFDRQVDAGRRSDQVGRIWVHTHPGSLPQPSGTDEKPSPASSAAPTGRSCSSWPATVDLCPPGVPHRAGWFPAPAGRGGLWPPFPASDQAAWREAYLANVQVEEWPPEPRLLGHLEPSGEQPGPLNPDADWRDLWDEVFQDKLVDSCTKSP